MLIIISILLFIIYALIAYIVNRNKKHHETINYLSTKIIKQKGINITSEEYQKLLNGQKECNIEILTLENKISSIQLNIIASLNNTGSDYEKNNEIEKAIAIYEYNCGLIFCRGCHSFERLMIIYRRNKDYINEKRIIELAIQKFPQDTKYKERLLKVETLLSKQQ